MGTVKVTNIEPIADNGTLTIGNSGDTIALTAGAKTSGFGKIGQIIQATTSTTTTVDGTTFADSGLSASITPSSTSSKILIIVSQSTAVERTTNTSYVLGGYRLLRGSTAIWQPNPEDGNGNYGLGTQIASGTNVLNVNLFNCMNYLDSPATTSATTYKTQMRGYQSAGRMIAQKSGSNSNGKSSMILMEVLD